MDRTVGMTGAAATGSESPFSAVSWGAVLAGAFVASALGLLLVMIGAGLGLASVSPWSASNPSAGAFSLIAALWILLSQLLSAALGGYLAGRLRTKWAGTDRDEVYFRDTAHGLLVWAVGAVIGATIFAHAATAVVSGGAQMAAMGGGAAAAAASDRDSGGSYYVDMLFRSDNENAGMTRPFPTAEVSHILAVSMRDGTMSPADKTHLAQLIAARTALTQAEAEQRIDEVINDAKTAADKARKGAAAFAIWAALALLVGAFSASYAATFGGRARDRI